MNKLLPGIFYLFICTSVIAQDVTELRAALYAAGFEQVLIFPMRSTSEGSVYMTGVEHRGINNPAEAVRLANSISQELGFNQNKFVLLYKGQALFESTIEHQSIRAVNQNKFVLLYKGQSTSEHQSIRTADFSDTDAMDLFRKFSVSKYRFNVVIDPDIQIRFGYFENPIQSKIGVLIGSDIILARGLSLFAGLMIPIQNDLDSESNQLKLGPTFFEYFTPLAKNHYTQLSVGLFHNNRYGLDFEYRFFPYDGRLSLGFRYAKTGFYYFPNKSIFFDPITDDLIVGNIEFLLPKERVSISLDFGQFLENDRGIRFSVFKQYKNIEVGFFSTATVLGNTSGFNFTIPLVPGKLIRSKSIELRTNDSFRWEYSYSNEGAIGREFNATRTIKNNLRRFNSNLFDKY
jgi:hypothetical protein